MKKYLILPLICLVLSCGTRSPETVISGTLITDVQLVDVKTGTVLENRHIAIDSGRIAEIYTQLPDTSAFHEILHGKGAYAIPGLSEMHAHIPSPPASDTLIRETLFLYLSNGITTIRGMLGHPHHLELKKLQQQGSLDAPRIYSSSPSLNGNSVPSAAVARELVTQFAAEGYDFLKIHPGIQRDVFDTLVAVAKAEAIPFAGHVPVDVGIRHALKSGYATIDHVDGFLEGLVPASQKPDPTANGFFGYNFTLLADPGAVEELVSLTAENQVWVVPTQSLFERWFSPVPVDSLLAQPEMIYMAPATLSNWKNTKLRTLENSDFKAATWKVFDSIRLKLIYALQHNGHGLLLGSDAPQLFNVPGFSIHHEMRGMLRAGLTPLEILQSGTLNPAKYLGIEEAAGSLEVGKNADLVLLSANPLESLDALKKIEGVMVNGKWFSANSIATTLKTIAKN
jgi:hypothetical protein